MISSALTSCCFESALQNPNRRVLRAVNSKSRRKSAGCVSTCWVLGAGCWGSSKMIGSSQCGEHTRSCENLEYIGAREMWSCDPLPARERLQNGMKHYVGGILHKRSWMHMSVVMLSFKGTSTSVDKRVRFFRTRFISFRYSLLPFWFLGRGGPESSAKKMSRPSMACVAFSRLMG